MEGKVSAEQWHKLSAFMDTASVLVPRHYVPRCCLAATRITVEVLGRLHIAARPLVVQVAVHNPALVAKGRPPASAQEARQWLDRDNAGLILCSKTTKPERPGPGHLVAIALERFLIDLALPQFNRPDKEITLTPILCSAPNTFLTGLGSLSCDLNGCRVFYEALVGDESYVGGGDWDDLGRHERVIETICASVERAVRIP